MLICSTETIEPQSGGLPCFWLLDYSDYVRLNSLNYNHWLITQQTGYLLHPGILINSSELRIADVGTGTG